MRDEQGKANTRPLRSGERDAAKRVPERAPNVAEQQSTIAELKTTVAQQQKQIEALTATVQKVSDQVALSKPAPQLVANP